MDATRYQKHIMFMVAILVVLMGSLAGVSILSFIAIPTQGTVSNAYLMLETKTEYLQKKVDAHVDKDYFTACKEAWYLVEGRVFALEKEAGVSSPLNRQFDMRKILEKPNEKILSGAK